MPELADLYSDRILEIAGRISRTTRLAAPAASASAHSKMCGSTITVDLAVADGRISDFGQTVRACLLGQAAASVMAAEIVGSTPTEVRAVGEAMRRMLKTEGTPPGGRWADLAALEPVREVKGRHASTLLVFEAVERALDALETPAATKPAAATV